MHRIKVGQASVAFGNLSKFVEVTDGNGGHQDFELQEFIKKLGIEVEDLEKCLTAMRKPKGVLLKGVFEETKIRAEEARKWCASEEGQKAVHDIAHRGFLENERLKESQSFE